MSGSKDKKTRKENQLARRDINEIFNYAMARQLTLPFRVRWRIAFRILRGK